MKTMFSVLVVLAMSCGSAAAQTAGPETTPELTAAVTAADAALFSALFDRCDVAALRTMVADDLEFFHDKSGLHSSSGAQWIDGVAKMCERQKAGTDYTARRELDAATSEVHPLATWGAIHTGTHRFTATSGEKKGQLVEVSKFFNVWKREGSGWRLARVFSYQHRLTP
jgi:ketosteroid isomerase-like protein